MHFLGLAVGIIFVICSLKVFHFAVFNFSKKKDKSTNIVIANID